VKILEVLTYYRPHVSGLTFYVERISRALADRGHDVTVLTSQYERQLPVSESVGGVTIRRVPVAMRISKGVIMPSFGLLAWKYVRDADLIHLHLPQFDAPGVALRGKLLGKPVVVTYHSDLSLPKGLFNRAVETVVHRLNRMTGALADAVVTYTTDFGLHSPYLSRYVDSKLVVIQPPVEVTPIAGAELSEFRARHAPLPGPVIGVCARLAAEKGIEVLLSALPEILKVYPEAIILHAGPFENVLGEEEYSRMLQPLLAEAGNRYRFVGPLYDGQLAAFYHSLDCLVMPSLNNTETFGLVQIEAMMSGVPAVASDLPGVRQPVSLTGMGRIAAVGDQVSLAAAILDVLDSRSELVQPAEAIEEAFSPAGAAAEYERLFDSLLEGKRPRQFGEPAAYLTLRSRCGT